MVWLYIRAARDCRLFLALALVAAATPVAADPVFRTIDGTGNNIANPNWGAVGTALLRAGGPAYADGISAPAANPAWPNPRVVSNAVVAQPSNLPNAKGASDYLWAWGQFLDHDLDLTTSNPAEPFNVPILPGDPRFPAGEMPFNRSITVPGTGTSIANPRQQPNVVSTYIDASMVYGSDATTALSLRAATGGRLKTIETPQGELLPLKGPDGTIKSGGATFVAGDVFLAGDVRVNENVVLTSLHTLLVREHNRLAQQIAAANPTFNDERIYQEARKIVGAEIQSITYNEFLPLLIGGSTISGYAGYDPSVDVGIRTEFSTAGFRLGHTLLSSVLRRVDAAGNTIPEGNLLLRNAFFRPDRVLTEGGIVPLLSSGSRGSARRRSIPSSSITCATS